jgi:hypothetical protein
MGVFSKVLLTLRLADTQAVEQVRHAVPFFIERFSLFLLTAHVASVQGEHVRIDGRVDGNVHARGTLEINGHVSGDILYCGTIRLGPRAALNGTLKRVSRMLTIETDATVPDVANRAPITAAVAAEPAADSAVPLTPQTSNVTEFARAKV